MMCNSSPSSPSSSDSNIISGTNEIGKLISDYYICKISKNGRSPLLFNYYVSDIPAGISRTIAEYADDLPSVFEAYSESDCSVLA